ncbi:MAG: hypothetical protein KJO39_01390 [Bacteroidia bacterium]|nr:hypothetical protein [Bacteroidia bacterium]NNF30919.1 hypothetical protein [Flavobacteriaceae bacterium]NNK54329.1 hypothetical protein [Flavobacteriaceae bacterium]NNM07741.1 hypothetical protein [Flavobacteriaceae bacterium]
MKYSMTIIFVSFAVIFSSFKILKETPYTDANSSEPTLTTITVTSPTGGQDYCFKQQQTITWLTSGGTVSTVSIYLMQPDGQTINRTIASNISNNGSYLWNGFATGLGNYLIKISGTDDTTPTLVTGQTGTFTLKDCIKPDLNPQLSSITPLTRWRKRFEITISNIGTKVVQNPTIKIEIDRPGNLPTSNFTTTLNETIDINERVPFSKGIKMREPGNYTITTILDPNDLIDEVDETNNSHTISLDVPPVPELIVYISNGKRPPVGREREIRIVVKNVGTGETHPNASFQIRSYVKQKGVKHYDIPQLDMGETFTIKRKHKWGLSGTKSLNAKILYVGLEMDANNNFVESSFFVRLPHHDRYSLAPKVKCSTGETFRNWDGIEN